MIMVKAPRLGTVKTRLAREIGGVAALRFYRNATRSILARLGSDPRWRAVVAVTPDTSLAAPYWPGRLARVAQGTGDLGARMQRLLDQGPPGPVLIIGTDIPAVRAADIAGAFRALRGHAAVFGPAEDGGYWLVGCGRRPRTPRLFESVRWSGPHALADTIANLGGRPAAQASRLSDVDCAADYRRLGGVAARVVMPAR